MQFTPKSLIAALFLTTALTVAQGAPPLWKCDFESWNENNTRAFLSGTTQRFFGASKAENQGFNGSTGMLADAKHSAQITYCPEMASATEFTFETMFKLNEPVAKRYGHTIVSIPKKDWGAGIFRLNLMPDKCFEASFHTNLHKPEEDRKSVLRTEPQEIDPDIFYTIRVAAKHDGPMKIWLDGRLIGEMQSGAWSLSDLPDTDTRQYFPIVVPGMDYSELREENFRTLNGIIDNIRFWDSFEEISVADASTVLFAETVQMPFFNNGNTFVTSPFQVQDRPGELLGTTQPAEERFLKAAAHAEFSMDDTYFYAKIISPRADGTEFNTKGSSVWNGDIVEFFLRPDITKTEYFQYAINANGSHESLAYSAPMASLNGFSSKAEFINTVTDDVWTAEFKIPREELKLANLPDGTIFQLNATRSGKNCGGTSSWSPSLGNYHGISTYNRAAVGTPAQAARNIYEAMSGRVGAIKQDSEALQHLKKEFQAVSDLIEKSADTPDLFFKVETMLSILEPQVISQEMGSMTSVIWRPAQPWGNNLKISPTTTKLEEINITMAQDTQAWYGFAFSNLTKDSYLGQLKLFREERVQKNQVWQQYNKRISGMDSPLFSRIQLFEALEVHAGTSDPIYDPLIPLPLNTLIRAGAGQTVPLWLHVSSKGLEPGTYSGIFYLKGSKKGFEDQEIKLNVTVKPVDLKGIHVESFMYQLQLVRNPSKELIDFMVDGDCSIIYRDCIGTWDKDYPLVDKEGNIVEPSDFGPWDYIIDEHIKRGMEKERIRLLLWLELTLHGLRRNGSIPFPFNSEKWNLVFRQWVSDFTNHFKQKYGFTDRQFIFYPVDEPSGDLNDPKSSISNALLQAKLVKNANPNVLTMINPLPDFLRTFTENKELQEQLLPYFDILEFFRPYVSPKIAEWARGTGKEIWTYGIYCNTDAPLTYRREYWQSLNDGFDEVVTYWSMDDFGGCDGFCDFDGERRQTDYGTTYCETDYGKILTGRRQIAHDLGREDYRIAKFCRSILEKKKSESLEAEFNAIIQEGVNGTQEELEQASEKLLEFAEKISR